MGRPEHLNTLGGYLVRHGDRVVLVDAGVGLQPIFPFVGGALRSALKAPASSPTRPTGWIGETGTSTSPTVTSCPAEGALCNPATDHPSIRLAPVVDRLALFEGEQFVLPGIRALEASGHTPGETVLELESTGALPR